MSDPKPLTHNRLAVALGYLFHPFVLFFPVAAVVLSGQSPREALGWILLMAVVAILPTALLLTHRQRQGQYSYLRQNRLPLYLTAWTSAMLCGMVLWALDAPTRLLQCTFTIAIWIPVQTIINERYTKISGHTAFSMGVMIGLAWMGELETIEKQLIAIGVILATAWARYVTQHHTLEQILLGWGMATTMVSLGFWLVG